MHAFHGCCVLVWTSLGICVCWIYYLRVIFFNPPPSFPFYFGLSIFWYLTRKHVITVLKDTNICHICLNKFSIKSDIFTSVHIQACLYTGIEQHAQPSYMVYTYTCRQSFEVLLAYMLFVQWILYLLISYLICTKYIVTSILTYIVLIWLKILCMMYNYVCYEVALSFRFFFQGPTTRKL